MRSREIPLNDRPANAASSGAPRANGRRSRHRACFVGWLIAAICASTIALDALERPDTAHVRQPAQVQERCRNVQGAQPFARTELFFGRAKPDGSMITDDEFSTFVDEIITPRFPDGWTALSGAGQFRGASGMIQREGSVFVILLYPAGDRSSSERIEEIRNGYRDAFAQDSVLRVDAESCVDF
jgi:hypothetical protein